MSLETATQQAKRPKGNTRSRWYLSMLAQANKKLSGESLVINRAESENLYIEQRQVWVDPRTVEMWQVQIARSEEFRDVTCTVYRLEHITSVKRDDAAAENSEQ